MTNFVILFIVLEYIAITYAFGLIYKLIGWKSSAYIRSNFGWAGYCILGSFGVTFHELSHLVTAILFRHKINEVRLFRPFQGKADGTLGYVNHSWNQKSLYQKIGNFFIGTAPMFFGAGLLFLLLRVAYPAVFVSIAEISDVPSALGAAFMNMLKPSSLLTQWMPIIIVAAIFICPYMHMSWADVKGATSGAITMIIVAVGLSLVSAVIPVYTVAQIQRVMNTFVTYYFYALILGFIMSIAMALCFGLISLIRGKGL